jgi:hypothetical protein
MTKLASHSSERARQAISEGGLDNHLDIASDPEFATHPMTAPQLRRRLSPEERAKVCHAIHRYLEIEATRAATAKRNIRLRLAIGLRPVPRSLVSRERTE